MLDRFGWVDLISVRLDSGDACWLMIGLVGVVWFWLDSVWLVWAGFGSL